MSISTGYPKRKIAENANKLEIWIVPRFLVEKEIEGDARHLEAIFPAKWPTEAPIGILWTWGGWGVDWYDYLTTEAVESLGSQSLYLKWLLAGQTLFEYLSYKVPAGRLPWDAIEGEEVFSSFFFELK